MLLSDCMNKNIYKDKKTKETADKAVLMYQQGLTTREIGKIIGKSHAWVALKVKEKLSPVLINEAIDKF